MEQNEVYEDKARVRRPGEETALISIILLRHGRFEGGSWVAIQKQVFFVVFYTCLVK